MMLNFGYDSWVQVNSLNLTGECFNGTLTACDDFFLPFQTHVISWNQDRAPLIRIVNTQRI